MLALTDICRANRELSSVSILTETDLMLSLFWIHECILAAFPSLILAGSTKD